MWIVKDEGKVEGGDRSRRLQDMARVEENRARDKKWHSELKKKMDYLVKTGLELNRMYVYRGCAPTRSSFQTGRLPIHVTTSNGDGISDPNQGIPQEMTVIASKLRSVGYKTHLVGKWDAGFATWQQLPIFRGYDYFYGYLGKTIDYFDKTSINDCRKLLCFVYQLIPICHFVTLSISCIN